ncbi:hypothetical protein BDW59DRAFT_16114 [Aspergillus cavernicola]|uniref:Uncharacterized protein n=1 Tax=Aspergillus cavernicola TaxID=176166 RepID=A0ABR4HIY5_9EURO
MHRHDMYIDINLHSDEAICSVRIRPTLPLSCALLKKLECVCVAASLRAIDHAAQDKMICSRWCKSEILVLQPVSSRHRRVIHTYRVVAAAELALNLMLEIFLEEIQAPMLKTHAEGPGNICLRRWCDSELSEAQLRRLGRQAVSDLPTLIIRQ